MIPTKEQVKLTPEFNEAMKSLGWKWEPKVGDWFIDIPTGKIYLIDHDTFMEIRDDKEFMLGIMLPLPHWEDDIEPFLEGLGYFVRILRNVDKDSDGNHLCQCAIDQNAGHIAKAISNTRQFAMMQAVIALAKEAKK